MKLFLISIASVCTISSVNSTSTAEVGNCSSYYELLTNLYTTGDNLFNLTKVFYPPRDQPPPFIHVTYTFNDVDCSVDYLWAEGGFLLIQPPSIFQLTSLLFNQEKGENDCLHLTLPSVCRELVLNNNSNCSCHIGANNTRSKMLELLTQQLKSIAKYDDAKFTIRDNSAGAYAICEQNLDDVYYVIGKLHTNRAIGVIIFFTMLFLLPLMAIGLVTTVVRSLHLPVHVGVIRPSNHKTVAGMVLTGVFFTFYIVSCDVAGVFYFVRALRGESELGQNHNLKSTVSFFSTVILLVADSVAFVHVVLVLLYICCKHSYENIADKDSCKICFGRRCDAKPCCEQISKFCILHILSQYFYASFYAIFGTLDQNKVWKSEEKTLTVNAATTDDEEANDQEPPTADDQVDKETRANFKNVWVLVIALAAPVFTISAHIGFILVSWLTDTHEASSVALFYLAVLFYLFFMFRQCYSANSHIEPQDCCWSLFLPLYPFIQCCKYLGVFIYLLFCCNKCKERDHGNNSHRALHEVSKMKTIHGIDETEKFNTKAFCIVFSWGWIFVLPIALVFIAFTELPIKTVDLFSDLLNTFQVLILLVSLLITYKVISLRETDLSRFLKHLRKRYKEVRETTRQDATAVAGVDDVDGVDDVEAAAYLMADVVVDKLHPKRETNSNQLIQHVDV